LDIPHVSAAAIDVHGGYMKGTLVVETGVP